VPHSVLAERCGVSLAITYQWRSGRKVPSDARIAEIARALGVAPEGLLEPSPDTLELDQFSGADWMLHIKGEDAEAGIDLSKVQRGLWRIPANAVLPHASQQPQLKVLLVKGNALVPDFSDGDYALVDLNWRVMSPAGIYLISEPMHFAMKRCELLSGEKDGWVHLRDAYFESETRIEEVNVIGRIISKLLQPK